jgi:ketosteroid isomerase-like protein
MNLIPPSSTPDSGHDEAKPVGTATRSLVEALRQADDARVAALQQANIDVLQDLMADDLVYVHASGRVETKADYLDNLRRGITRFLSFQYEGERVIRLHGASVAVVTGTVTISVQLKSGPPKGRTLAVSAVYYRQDRCWRMISYQSTPVVPSSSGQAG